jgi:hypothetical protein
MRAGVDLPSRLFWGLLLIAAALLWFLYTAGAITPLFLDLARRGAPVVLIFIGLALLLSRRAPLGGFLAFAIAAGALSATIMVAYGQQGDILRADYQAPFEFEMPADTNILNISVDTLRTQIEVLPAEAGNERVVSGIFSGPQDSIAGINFQLREEAAFFELQEAKRGTGSLLSDVGRAKLTLYLPAGVRHAQVRINTAEGAISFDAARLQIDQLALTAQAGDIVAALNADASITLIGDLVARAGSVSVSLPAGVNAQIALRGAAAGAPRYPPQRYIRTADNVLLPNGGGGAQITITIDAANTITITDAGVP